MNGAQSAPQSARQSTRQAAAPRLALFDCDGTLADSQHAITSAMDAAFRACGHTPPAPADVRAIIGLSVDRALMALAPQLDARAMDALGDCYRDTFFRHRTQAGNAPEPLFDGVADALATLVDAGWILGVATGKSQRGLGRLLAAHGLAHHFATLQTADFHPSKPHPAMVHAALAQTGVPARRCVVIGDTSFDMGMAVAAGAGALGVAWGYHPPATLRGAGAMAMVDHPADIAAAAAALLGMMEDAE
ncbi:MAG: HAD-IA family hydrolase [Sphingopyxis sp.]